jgi:hypothetical protein
VSAVRRQWLRAAVPVVALTVLGAAGVVLVLVPPVGASVPDAALLTGDGRTVVDGTTLGDPAAVLPLRAVVPSGDPVDDVKYVLDGSYLGAVPTAPYVAPISTLAGGQHKIRVTIESRDPDIEFTVHFTVSGTVPSPTPTPTPTPTTSSPSPPPPVDCGTPDVVASDAQSLAAALAAAHPGETIGLADGTYLGDTVRDRSGTEPGRFVAKVSGTRDAPIRLCGSRNAVLDGGGPGGGYGLHLVGVRYWQLEGFTVSGASKGIVLDGSNHVLIDHVAVTNIGMEGVHFRSFSSDNVLRRSVITHTGVRSPNYGEGVYLGSANSNWGTYTGGLPDRSDRNRVLGNTISDTGAENIDIKEGTTGGIIRRNLLDGDGVGGENSADSWIDVKGNGYLISDNHGVHTSVTLDPTRYKNCDAPRDPRYPDAKDAPFCNGFEVHTAVAGWGQDNQFAANVLDVDANTDNPVVGIWLQNTAVGVGNVIRCDNVVRGATVGDYAYNHFTLIDCTS